MVLLYLPSLDVGRACMVDLGKHSAGGNVSKTGQPEKQSFVRAHGGGWML